MSTTLVSSSFGASYDQIDKRKADKMASDTKERLAIRRSRNVPAYNQLADILEQQIAVLPDEERARVLPSQCEMSR